MPNPASEEAPEGGEDDFEVLEIVGTPRDFAAEGFEPRDHLELGQMLGAIDVERGAKVSGARFYYLTGVGARLELALTQLAMAKASEWGFTPMIPPALVKPSAMEGTGFLGQAADDVYYLEKDDLYLVGTSEVALAAYHSDEILDAESAAAPLCRASAPAIRREAGSYGKDTRGIFRVHWFDKVEMFVFTTLEESFAEHERILAGSARGSTPSSCRIASSTSRPATSASRPSASSTARPGSRPRSATARCRRPPTARSSRLVASTSAPVAATGPPRRWPRSTARCAP